MPSSCKIGAEAVMKSWSKMSKGTVVECSMGRWTGTYTFPTKAISMGKIWKNEVVFMRPVLIFTGELAMFTIFSGQLAFVGTVGNFLGKMPDVIGGNWRKSVKLMGDGLTSGINSGSLRAFFLRFTWGIKWAHLGHKWTNF